MNTIQQQWDLFHELIVPKTALPVQVREMRRSFYAGASAVLNITEKIGERSTSEEAGVQILEGLHQEIRDFAERIGKGV